MRYSSHLTTDYGEVGNDYAPRRRHQEEIRQEWRKDVAALMATVITDKRAACKAEKKPTLQQVQAEVLGSLAAKSKLPVLQKQEIWERITNKEETRLALTIYRDALTTFVTTHPEPKSWAVKQANKLLDRYARKVL